MFTKVLVANRGEIAVRVIRTLKRLGIASVAVFSEADRESLHVEAADEAVFLGPAAASESYLNVPALLKVCQDTGAQAVHPGYGFLSENADFARALQEAGIVFVGPTPENMEAFGLKHRARAAAVEAGVRLLPGSGLLDSTASAASNAEEIGWPVILKSTGGGGGIGMRVCRSVGELEEAFEGTKALAGRNFKDSGVYLERYVEEARHLEVQIFGDGKGRVAVLGDRDCSAQRRNQKVVEEAPAPGLTAPVRRELHDAARRLAASQNYANAGTVEFVYDTRRGEFFFLEVNTRLQVEHTVTEEVFGIDLVEWMLRQSAGLWSADEADALVPKGTALQVRLYAEDPWKNFLPSEGLITQTHWPENIRLETWVRPGVRMTTNYDPLLAKLIVRADTREAGVGRMVEALESLRIGGIETNRAYLAALLSHKVFRDGLTTRFLSDFQCLENAFEVRRPGTQTTVQDWPGRTGYWMVGIPPSGPMDELAFRLANRLAGNPETAAALEITQSGPELVFRNTTRIVLTGAPCPAALDGVPVSFWKVFAVQAGQVLTLGAIGQGQRAYLAVSGGLDLPVYLGSRSTFTLGGFGGHGGRALRTGDVVAFHPGEGADAAPPARWVQPYFFQTGWRADRIRVLYGPQGAGTPENPDFFKASDIDRFLAADWEVHFNSSRTGVRLIGPVPDWPRQDGGEAGLHPSNLHDNPYAVGAMDFTGDMPVLLGPDGPSLGGFVCPFTVIRADLWKLGQLAPGDKIRFQAVGLQEARTAVLELESLVQDLDWTPGVEPGPSRLEPFVLDRWKDTEGRELVVRRSGDRCLLLEVGPQILDLELRLAIQWWYQELQSRAFPGVLDLTPGIRSLQIHFDDRQTTWEILLPWLKEKSAHMPSLEEVEVPSRTVWLPLSWDDPSTRLAIEKYMTGVRPDAPWCPWNIEFIRRINGLERWEEVRSILFDASYLVLGLGDVYLGAPVAVPLDPRHRLVTTKYNPARTWTPENAVGIGGAYLCVYGMEGPGGYQFVGRTVQMWNRFFRTPEFREPCLLRFFDRLRFYPVSSEELETLRKDFPLGRAGLKIEEGVFRWKDYRDFLKTVEGECARFRRVQQSAFEQERQRWKSEGLDSFQSEVQSSATDEVILPEGSSAVESPLSGSLWQWAASVGDRVEKGQTLAVIESMKMEIQVEAPFSGTLVALYKKTGDQLAPGQTLLALKEES